MTSRPTVDLASTVGRFLFVSPPHDEPHLEAIFFVTDTDMIDLHCHILHGVDDGPATLEQSVCMARVAAGDGVATVVASPHVFHPRFDVSLAARDAALSALRTRLQEEGIPLDVLPGAECRINENLLNCLENDTRLLLGNGSKSVLVEWPTEMIPIGFDDFLFEARSANLTPILAHPERYDEVQADWRCLEAFVEADLVLQLTAGSLLGAFGRRVQRTAEKLLKRGWVSVIASDAHDCDVRTPRLAAAVERARRLVGDAALDLVTTNPARLIGR